MPLNLSGRRAFARLALLFLAASILRSHSADDRDFLGRMQVGDAGAVCSFFTTLFDGPDVGRGRNEGHSKSIGEIYSLFGPFGIKARRQAWELAATGMGLDEYNAMTYAPPDLSLKEDTLITAKAVRDRQLANSKDVRAYYRHLFAGCFLNTDVLIDSGEQGGIGLEEVREQLWRWLGYTYKDYRLDYYLFNGNRNMVRKLYSRGIISKKEATYLLARWFLERTAYEPSMIEDMEYFGITSPADTKLLVKLELAYLPPFHCAPAARHKLLAEHAVLYDSVRPLAAWPLTIPRLSKIKAIAPSLSNRYADAYDPNQYIAMEHLLIPQPVGRFKGYDPRIAVSINDGRKLSATEHLSRWYLGNILSVFGAAHGDTQTAYVFNHRLVSPASRLCVELVALAGRKGVISADQQAEYLLACMRAGYCSRSIYLDAKAHNRPLLPEMMQNRMFFRRAVVDGIDYDDYSVMTTVAGGVYSNTVSDLVRYGVSNFETSINANTIMCAEKTGQISRREADALLVAHFYQLLEQLTDPAWVRTKFEPGWRMRAQRLEVERAVYEFKADQAAAAVRKLRSPHD